MKILIISQHFFPEQFRINDIAKSLMDSGHEVTVLTGLPNYPTGVIDQDYRCFKKRHETIEGIEIIRLPIFARGKKSMFRLALNYMSFAIYGSIRVLFIKRKFDVAYVFQVSPVTMILPAAVLKFKTKTPMLVHCLDQWPISVLTGPIKRDGIIYSGLIHLSRFLYRQADVIMTSSPSFVSYFEDELKITPLSKKIIYWPSYAEDTYKESKHVENGIFDLVYAGNIGPALSVETIVKAAILLKEQKNIHFHIVGDGLSREDCEKLANEQLLNNITFHGFFKVEDMSRFYNLADAFLITMVDNEIVNHTIPAKLQSYMLAGKPIIGAIAGDVEKIIHEAKCGLTCPSEDGLGLSEIILDAYHRQNEFKIWGSNARDYYQSHFDKQNAMTKLQKILEDMTVGGSNVTC